MQAVRRCAQVTLALSALLAQHPAEAACNRPDIQFAVPPDGADGVPPNAKLFARYRSNAEYTGEEINLQQVGGSTQQLTGEWSSAETLLGVVPSLEPGESYSIDWPRLRGVNSASLGKGKTVAFDVGSSLDEAPPGGQGRPLSAEGVPPDAQGGVCLRVVGQAEEVALGAAVEAMAEVVGLFLGRA